MYLEDIDMKNTFFTELENLKTNWTLYADEPERKVYTK